MIWLILAILAAVSDGIKDFLNRVVMIKDDPYVFGFVQNLISFYIVSSNILNF